MTPKNKPSVGARVLIWFVVVYRATLSRVIGGQCRFHPTCSFYAIEALESHGAWRGSRLAVARIFRCHPWGKTGYDPVPCPREQKEKAEPETFRERTGPSGRK